MPSVFISYRRTPSAMLATLIARELQARGINTYLDTRQTDGGGPFPQRLLAAIEQQDVFLCLVAEGTFESNWVQREIAHAHSIGKVMIPVFQESYVPVSEPPDAAIGALLHHDGVHVMDVRNIYVDQAIDDLAQMIKQSTPRRRAATRLRGGRVALAAAVVALIAVVAVLVLLSGVLDRTGDDDPDDRAAAPSATPPDEAAPLDPGDGKDTQAYGSNSNTAWNPEYGEHNGVSFVNVPSGCFDMGADDGDPTAMPAHLVCLDEYWIGEYPVTNAQYAECIDAGACTLPTNPVYINDLYTFGDYPAVYVSWNQAQQYAQWLGASLPTEAQWEFAARGPENWRYASGNEPPGCADAMTIECTDGELVPVTAAEGSSWAGAYGMTGGVWEWVSDYYGEYPQEDWIDNPTGPVVGDRHPVRGGAFDATVTESDATARVGLDPGTATGHVGFRVAINWDLREDAK